MADREARKDAAQRQDVSMKRNASVPFSFNVGCHLHVFSSHPFFQWLKSLGVVSFFSLLVFVRKIFPRRALRARRGVFLYEMKLSIWRRPTPLGSEKVGQFVELREGSPRILSLLACSGHAKFVFRAPFRPLPGSLGDLLGPAWPPWAVAGINLIEELIDVEQM